MVYCAKKRIARALEQLFGVAINGTAPIYDSEVRIAQACESAVDDLGDISNLWDVIDALDDRIHVIECEFTKVKVTAKVDSVATAGIVVTVKNAAHTYTGTTDNNGVATIHVAPGEYAVSGGYDPEVYENITGDTATAVFNTEVTANVSATTIES